MKAPLLLLVGLTAGLSFTGCTTTGTNAQIAGQNETRLAIDRNTTAGLAVGMATVTGKTAPIEAAAAKIGEQMAASDARYEELRAELERQKLEFSNFVNGALAIVGEVATELVPGGTTAARVLGVIKKNVDTAQTSANKAQQEGEAARQKAVDALAEAEKQIAALKAEVAEKEAGLKDRITAEETRQAREMEFARKELSLISAAEAEELRRELIVLAKENGLEGADGMSTEELLAALGAGGLGLAGLLRTFGKSRSQQEIDQLWDKVDNVQKDVANVQGKVAG